MIMLYPISERGGLLGLKQGCHHLPGYSTNRETIRQLSGIVQPRHHVYAVSLLTLEAYRVILFYLEPNSRVKCYSLAYTSLI